MADKVKPPTPPSSSPQRVTLDWRGYFYEFCRRHGEPVKVEDRLLFRDGWAYSSHSYEGPEYPPPLDPDALDRLVVQYWELRQRECTGSLDRLLFQRERLVGLQAQHSAPLQQVIVSEGEGGKKVRGFGTLDLSGLNQRIDWVRSDLVECGERLREIEDFRLKRKGGAA